MLLMGIIYILIIVIFILMMFAYVQIKIAGMNVKDFYSFIEANQM